jgi:uncharacterized membrane protein YoaK (UPF0700 family)
MEKKPSYALASFLTWIAGFVDAVGYLALGHIYTANMSGNSVAIGIHLVSQEWAQTLRRSLPVFGYVAGVLFCRILIEFGARKRIRPIASIAWLFEIALLIPVCAVNFRNGESWTFQSLISIALLALGMGIQNATLTHFSSLTLNTGFVTGTLVKFAEQATKYLTWIYDRVSSRETPPAKALVESFRQNAFRVTLWLAFMWIAYIAGACCGAVSEYTFTLKGLWAPIGGLAVLIAIDLRRPLGLEEERLQEKLPA